MGRFRGKTCRLLTMFVLTLAFFLLEVIYGYITNSIALIADAFHMLSDVLALIVAFVCMKLSKVTRTPTNTFGWVRAEVIGALVNTVFLIALSFSIILQSIQRLFEIEYIKNPEAVLIVGAAGLLVNLIGLFLFHEHSHGHSHGGHSHEKVAKESKVEKVWNGACNGSGTPVQNGKVFPQNGLHHVHTADHPQANGANITKTSSSSAAHMNMRGVWLHVLGDAFGSIVVIVNALVIWQTDVEFFQRYLDPILSLVISGIIISTSIPLLKESALVLMQSVPGHIQVDTIERNALTRFADQIVAIHEFHVWRLTGNKIVATMHVRCRKGLQSQTKLANDLKAFFHNEGIHSTTIQLETVENGHVTSTQCAIECPFMVNGEGASCAKDRCCVDHLTAQATPFEPFQLTGADKRADPLACPSYRSIHV